MGARLVLPSLLVLALLLSSAGVSGAQSPRPKSVRHAQASLTAAFTYQGRLTEGKIPANGPYDFRFRLYNESTGGTELGNPIMLDDVPVTDGLVTVQLDFGDVYDGSARWLEVSVRSATDTGSYTVLNPRQQLTATPYALRSFGVWRLNGNADADVDSFLGTSDARPLVFKTNNAEALRIDPTGHVAVGSASAGARLEASTLATSGIALMGTSATRAVIGRLGTTSCAGTFGVGGCAGYSGGIGVLGSSETGVGVHGETTSSRGVEGFAADGIGVLGDSDARGVVGTLGGNTCAGTYGVGGCGGKLGDGVVGHTDVGPNTKTAAAMHAFNWGGGDIFIGEASGSRKARIDGSGKGFFNSGVVTGGADYAESMPTSEDPADLEPGDVLAIDPEHGFAVHRSREPNSRLVAGVYSAQPSILGVGKHGLDDSLAGEVPVALLGVVPTKVSAENGPIQIGDLLVASSLPGHAMKARPEMVGGVPVYPTGAILGKALEPLEKGTSVIAVLVTLR